MAEKKKLLRKIHILDIFFIFLVITVIVVMVMKLSIPQEETVINTADLSFGSKTEQEVMITFITVPFEEIMLQEIHVGDQLVELKDYINGYVESVSIIDYDVTMVDNNGIVITEAHPYEKKAVIVVKATITYKEPIYKLGTMQITENKEFLFNTEEVKLETIVTDISPVTTVEE
ncbi:MAG: DUF4330 family protein [Vallitaleaceae bacterium]|jgi:hypothetical protein|nr:DUF4330 family protein [Vallitaleaceae bacterium]